MYWFLFKENKEVHFVIKASTQEDAEATLKDLTRIEKWQDHVGRYIDIVDEGFPNLQLIFNQTNQ